MQKRRKPPELRDPELTNRRRVFNQAAADAPSEIIMDTVFKGILSSRIRNRKFMEEFRNAGPMDAEGVIACIGNNKRDYPGTAAPFTVKRHRAFREGIRKIYWLENESALEKEGSSRHCPALIAEARNVAIADGLAFRIKFSGTIWHIAKSFGDIAPKSQVNPGYFTSMTGGKPVEIAEVFLRGEDDGELGTFKICVGGLKRKAGGLGIRSHIFGTLFFMIEGGFGSAWKAKDIAGSPEKFGGFIRKEFARMKGIILKVVPPQIAGAVKFYKCVKQVQP